jgi:hypothetical protein
VHKLFVQVSVAVLHQPLVDLRSLGWSAPGLGGGGGSSDQCHLLELGGVQNLQVATRHTLRFELEQVLNLTSPTRNDGSPVDINASPQSLPHTVPTFAIGASADDNVLVGCNGEQTLNCYASNGGIGNHSSSMACNSRVATVSPCAVKAGPASRVELQTTTGPTVGGFANLVRSSGTVGGTFRVAALLYPNAIQFCFLVKDAVNSMRTRHCSSMPKHTKLKTERRRDY